VSILYARISRKDSNISKNIGVPAKGSKERVPRDTTIVQGDYKLIKDIDTGRLFLFNLKKVFGATAWGHAALPFGIPGLRWLHWACKNRLTRVS